MILVNKFVVNCRRVRTQFYFALQAANNTVVGKHNDIKNM